MTGPGCEEEDDMSAGDPPQETVQEAIDRLLRHQHGEPDTQNVPISFALLKRIRGCCR
jgi:hypothetical protein